MSVDIQGEARGPLGSASMLPRPHVRRPGSKLWVVAPALATALWLSLVPRALAQDEPVEDPPARDEASDENEATAEQTEADDEEAEEAGACDDDASGEAAPGADGRPPIVVPPENTDDGRTPRRDVPDYDGREAPPASPEDIALWVPRVIFWPLRAFFQYVFRDGLGWVLTTAEREHWDFIQLLPFAQIRPTIGIAPTALIDFGLLPSIGLFMWVDDVLIPYNQLRVTIGFGGPEWLRASLLDRQRLSREVWIELLGEAWMRPDNRYYGLGPFGTNDQTAWFTRRWLQGELAIRIRPWRSSQLRVSAGLAANEFGDSDYLGDGDLTLTAAVGAGWFNALPAGWPGYSLYRQRIEGSIDTREPEPHLTGDLTVPQYTAGGVRIGAYVEHAFDLAHPLERQWVLWGGGAGGFIDIDRGRGIAIYSLVRMANALGSLDVPFMELPDFGTDLRMPGYWPGWIRGESAVMAAVEYRWPIGPGLAGTVTVASGNAFRTMFDEFTFGRLRMGFGVGIRTVGDPDNALLISAGIGTETFDEGLGVTAFRVVLGNVQGI